MHVWDVTTGQPLRTFTGHHARVNTVAWNADDNMCVSGSADGTLRFWDLRQRKNTESDICKHFRDAVTQLLVHEAHVFAGSADGYVRHFDLRRGEVVADNMGAPVVAIDLTPDSQSLLVADNKSSVKLFSVKLGEQLAAYTGHTCTKYAIKCKAAADGSFFAVGSEDAVCYLYGYLNNKPIGTLYGHTDVVAAVDVNRKTGAVVTGAFDGTVKYWVA